MPDLSRVKRPVFRGFLGIPDQGFFPFCLFVIGQAPGWFPGGKESPEHRFFYARDRSVWLQDDLGRTVSDRLQGNPVACVEGG